MSDIDPADAISGRRTLPETFTPDLVDSSTTPRKADREGLPAGYRMRADPHYVDQLTSRRSPDRAGRETDVVELDTASDARDRRDGRERRGDRALAQLAEDLATIESAIGLMGEETSTLGRRVSLDLVKAHVWRASWLIKAQALVDNPQRGYFRTRPLPALLARVREGLEPECRLNGLTLELQILDWQATMPVDEAGLTAGIAGAIVATFGLVPPADGAVVRVTLTGGDLPAIEVAQEAAGVRTNVAQRFFDPAWIDRPGGWVAALGAAAARAAAHQHGGSASFTLGDARGSILRLTLGRG